MVADTDYCLVNTDVNENDRHQAAELSKILRMRFPGRTVAMLHTDAFCVWRNGRGRAH